MTHILAVRTLGSAIIITMLAVRQLIGVISDKLTSVERISFLSVAFAWCISSCGDMALAKLVAVGSSETITIARDVGCNVIGKEEQDVVDSF